MSEERNVSPVNFRYYLIPADCCNSYRDDLDMKCEKSVSEKGQLVQKFFPKLGKVKIT